MKNVIGIFIRSRPFFGSQITTLPALYYLKKTYNNNPINLFSRYELSWFYEQCPWVESFSFSKNILSDLRVFPKNCHLLVSFQPSSESQSIVKFIKRPSEAIGFKRKQGIFSPSWDFEIPFNDSEYRASHYLRLVSKNKLDKNSTELPQHLSAPFHELAKHSKYPISYTPSSTRIAIMPGGGAGNFKKWGLKNYLELINAIRENHGSDIIFDIILGPSETEELSTLKKQKANYINLHHNLSLPDLSKVVNFSQLVIANDCGPSHIAQCLSKPYIGIYDKLKPEWIFQHADSKILTPPTDSAPISSISVETVKAHFSNMISRLYN
ncbi:MAG: glycosyl transferase family protein [Halomonadaceae bacterium T82-2]|nr:MAG: glycosyl transferase family protein [Halomonadaceae bacterium T82-2]